jgi:hypothetical protein
VSLSLSLLVMACVTEHTGTTAGESESSGQPETESGSLPSDESESDDETESESNDETESDDETETETGDPEPWDPQCGEWTSTLVQVDGLHEVRLDGDELIAAGGNVLVERDEGGAWSDYINFALGGYIFAYHEIWGPPEDRWVLARDGVGDVAVYQFDGDSLTLHTTFPDPPDDLQAPGMLPRELVGRGADDIWALTAPDCQCFFQPCNCYEISELQHWDGQSWSSVPTPGQLFDVALTDDGVWGVGHAGLVARYDGQNWTIDDLGDGALHHVWALDDDELWVSDRVAQLMHRSGGAWTSVQLPGPYSDIIALDGLAADQVWALDELGGLWAYDGLTWTKLVELPDAGGFAIVGQGEQLIVVGGEKRHMVWQVDTADGSVTLLHQRPNIYVETMIADDVDHMLLSSPTGRASWSFTDGVWTPAFGQLSHHFSALLGPIDDAIGVRNSSEYPEAVWQLGENPTPLPDPIEAGQFNDVIELEGQLWVGGRDHHWTPGPEELPFVAAYDGASWTDHSPPLIGSNDVVERMSAAGGRLFAHLGSSQVQRVMYLDDLDGDDWVSIPSPARDEQVAFADIAATASDQLWATRYVSPSQMQLLMWDGAQWHDATSLWPQLGAQCCWHRFAQGHGRLWMLSAGVDQSQQLAYFDGEDWTIVDTPPQLHGWGSQPQMAVGVDGLFIYDGIYMWRYAFCPA